MKNSTNKNYINTTAERYVVGTEATVDNYVDNKFSKNAIYGIIKICDYL